MTDWEKFEEKEYIEKIFSKEEQALEVQKWELVEELDKACLASFEDQMDSCLELIVANKEVCFYYKKSDLIDEDFLKTYLEKFVNNNALGNKTVDIYYKNFEGQYEKPSEKKAREQSESVRRSRKMDRKRRERDGF